MTGGRSSSRPLRGGKPAATARDFVLRPRTAVGREGQMENRLQALEEKVTRLIERVDQLEQRVSGAPLPSAPQSWPLAGADVGAPVGRAEVNRWVTFLGRSCLVL